MHINMFVLTEVESSIEYALFKLKRLQQLLNLLQYLTS